MIPKAVLDAAKADPDCWPRDLRKLAPIHCDGEVVGFYHPSRSCAYGRRLGPLFVLPEYRRRGLMRAVYEAESGPLVAFVLDNNPASLALHLSCGFRHWRRGPKGSWLRRD